MSEKLETIGDRHPALKTVLPTAKSYKNKHITVSEKNIEKGIQADSRKCVVAEAVKSCIPEAKSVSVDLATIRFTDKETGNRYTFMSPSSVQQAIVQFDQGIKPKPFEFHLKTLFQIRPSSAIPRKTPIAVIDREKGIPPRGDRAPMIVGGKPMPKKVDGVPILGYIRRFGLRTLPAKLGVAQPRDIPISGEESK